MKTFVCIFMILAVQGLLGEPMDISKKVEGMLEDSNVPGMSVAAFQGGEVVAVGAAGIRKKGEEEAVTIEDKFHLGSNTKSMTAVLAGILVDEGKLTWETTLEEVFPKVKMHKDFKKVTLEQLLTNTGGTPGDIDSKLWMELWDAKGPAEDQRMQLVRGILKEEPEYTPGEGYAYSNAGFSIAGAMLEKVTGEAYEELLTEKLFNPLGMASAGFRAPATLGKVDQPYGHSKKLFMIFSNDPEPAGDNPRAIAPAGAVHCNVLDYLKYAQFILGATHQDLLSASSRKKLFEVPGDEPYSMGWITEEIDWAGGLCHMHVGSNTMFHAVIWVLPEKDFTAVALCNYGEDEGFDKCDEAIALMMKEFF